MRFLLLALAAALAAAETVPMVRFGGELRFRTETAGDDLYSLSRIRLNVTVRPVGWLTFYAQGQDARVFGYGRRPIPSSVEDTADLGIGYVQIGDPEANRWSLRAGRQEISLGDGRMVGYIGWRNAANGFDAVRVMARGRRARLDLFSASVVHTLSGVNRPETGNRLYGAYGGVDLPGGTVEPYALIRVIRRVYTSYGGARWSGKHGPFEYDAELAAQSGGAWGGHWRVAPRVGMVRLNAEYNRGSAAFDPPYPTAHDRYGLADQIGWRNIRHLRFGADMEFHNHWSAILNMHQYWVTSRSGAVYTASGVPVASVRGGAQSNRAGWEPDVSIVWSPMRCVRMGTGYAYLFAGPFLREAGRSSYRYAYLFGEYTF